MKRSPPVAFSLAATAFAIGAAAHAQMVEETGSHIAVPAPTDLGDGQRLATADHARLAVDSYGRCVVARNRSGVKRALAAGSNSLGALATEDCLTAGEIRMPMPILRGSLYKALYRNDFAKSSPSEFAAAAPDFSKDPQLGKDPTYVGVRGYADCVVRKNPTGSRNLVMAQAGSMAENQAIAEVRPALGACLDNGQSLGFSKAMLEGFIAEVLYKESIAASAPDPAPVENRAVK